MDLNFAIDGSTFSLHNTFADRSVLLMGIAVAFLAGVLGLYVTGVGF